VLIDARTYPTPGHGTAFGAMAYPKSRMLVLLPAMRPVDINPWLVR